MFVYIDETGNTGSNFLDADQPVFYTGALMTRVDVDVDVDYAEEFRLLTSSLGVSELHGAELGLAGVNSVAGDLRKLLLKIPHALFFARVNKRDLVALKFFDTIFDPNDNPAASKAAYYAAPLRIHLAYELSKCLDTEALKTFWAAVSAPSEAAAFEKLSAACEMALARTAQVQDAVARKRVKDALRWAQANPAELTFYLRPRHLRAQHYANAAGFPALLHAIQAQSEVWGQKVIEIRHDEQDQFGPALRAFHDMMSSATPESKFGIGTEIIRLDAVPDSRFVMPSSSDSVGIQIVDVLLWVLKKRLDGRQLAKETRGLLPFALSSSHYELSFSALLRRGEQELRQLFARPITDEMLIRGAEILEAESNRTNQALRSLEAIPALQHLEDL